MSVYHWPMWPIKVKHREKKIFTLKKKKERKKGKKQKEKEIFKVNIKS